MTDYGENYDGNGKEHDGRDNAALSPQPQSTSRADEEFADAKRESRVRDRDSSKSRERDREKGRDKERDIDRDRHRERDRDRDRHRDRGERRDRGRDRDEDDHPRSRSYDSKRTSGFDMEPPASDLMPALSSTTAVAGCSC